MLDKEEEKTRRLMGEVVLTEDKVITLADDR